MKTLKSATKSEVQLLMDFDYNNVLGRIKYVLGKEASLFSDILIKNSEIHWMVRDDSRYVSLTELSSVVQSEVKGALSGRISYVLGIIAGDSLIGAYSDKILSFPSDEYVFVKEGKGDGDIILTGWGCKSLSHDSLHTSETSVKTMVEEPVKEEATNTEYIDSSPTPEDYIAETASEEKQERVSAEELQTIGNDTLINDSAVSDVTIETDVSGDTKYTSEWLKSNTEIHGWLSFFFFAIIVGGLISAVYPITTFDVTDYAGNLWIGLIDVLLGVGLFAIAIYTIFAFCKRKPNAVFYGRLYVILVLVTNVISVIGNDGTGFEGMTQAIRGIAWGIVWFLYLLFSNQVQEVIPKPFRKVSKIDWGVLTTIIIVPCLCFLIGMLSLDSKEDNKDYQETEIIDSQEAEIKDKLEARISEEIKSKIRTNLESKIRNQKLTVNERTDGRVIFTIPNGFECNSQEIELSPDTPITLFTISNESIGNIYICSDYDNDTSLKHFDECWGNWESEDDKTLAKTNVEKGNRTVNGHTCMYRIVRYNVNGVHVYWRFYLLFDKSSGKCCVASFYDRNESTGYVNETLKSIRFK